MRWAVQRSERPRIAESRFSFDVYQLFSVSAVVIAERSFGECFPNPGEVFMASRTVWIVGGLVVAIGAIAYLSYNKAPAGKDAAGTIVEAKRARADGTNSFNPTPTASTTDQNAADASKGTSGADAAKDAAAAASGSGDNVRRAQMEGGTRSSARDSADAAAAQAAGGNMKGGSMKGGSMKGGSMKADANATNLSSQADKQ